MMPWWCWCWSLTAAATAVTTMDIMRANQQRPDEEDGGNNQSSWHSNVLMALSSMAPTTLRLASCEESPPPTSTSTSTPPPSFAFGSDSSMLDDLVDEILRDKSINLTFLPDRIERRIYQSTIQLTLSLVHDLIGSIHGTELLSHEIHLRRHVNPNQQEAGPPSRSQRGLLYNQQSGEPQTTTTKIINDEVLEQVADRLLANRAINSSLLPDQIERQLYMNCIKIIFRTLSAVLDGLCLHVCGHDLRLSLRAANTTEEMVQQAAVRASMSVVDLDLLRTYAQQHAKINETNATLSFWDGLFLRKEFTAQLHAALYGLVLGIIDDILANTKIQLLGDVLELDIVPMTEETRQRKQRLATAAGALLDATVATGTTSSPSSQPRTLSAAPAFPIFAAGVGVGAALVTIATVLTGGSAR
jgi:hypothetical protein